MSLSPGDKLGPYEILAPLGAGGMGEVYKARDTRLGRDVAIKVLPEHLSSNPELKERFEREARAISSLNHPRICTLHDIGHQSGIDFLVMEYIDGQSLAQRLPKGPLPLQEVLNIGLEVSEALDVAHRAGIIHRDPKPGNIMLTKSGAKLMDFGLAKARPADVGAGPGAELAATRTMRGLGPMPPLSGAGQVIGTIQYMSPEQLEGKEADERSDIFAFGLVLYEMLTGKRAFDGASPASVISAIMTGEPAPMPACQPPVPDALERLTLICLAKAPDERWQSARDIKLQLRSMAGAPVPAMAALAHGGKRERIWMAIAAILLVTTALALLLRPPATAPAAPTRFQVRAPRNGAFTSLISAGRIGVSPDGRDLAFVARGGTGREMIWVRPLDSYAARALAGTEGAAHLFWSWDSRFIAFFADGKLKKIEAHALSGQAPVQVLCDAPGGRAGSWGRRDVILFSRLWQGPLWRVPAAGGTPEPATLLDATRREDDHSWPSFLPDGRHFLFLANGTIYVAALDSNERSSLLKAASNADYAPPGYLLFVRDRTLMAQMFDAARLKLAGTEFPVETRVGFAAVSGGNFSVSNSGVLVYGTGDDAITTQMVWYDRTGKRLSAVGEPAAYRQPQLSADGSKIVVERLDVGSRASDIWLYDLARGGSSRLTFGPGWQFIPVVSPDMRHIAFSRVGESADLLQRSTTGAGEAELLFSSASAKYFCDWSHDGKFALFVQIGDAAREDLWILPLSGDRKPFPFLQTQFAEEQAQFSPDGKWIAYASDETGRPEVYVQSFPASGLKLRISNNGGTQPRWRGDGKEMFYLSTDRAMMRVTVNSAAHFEAGAATTLFETPIESGLGPYMAYAYAVTADGKRFLLLDPVGTEDSAVSVVLNWTAGLNH